MSFLASRSLRLAAIALSFVGSLSLAAACGSNKNGGSASGPPLGGDAGGTGADASITDGASDASPVFEVATYLDAPLAETEAGVSPIFIEPPELTLVLVGGKPVTFNYTLLAQLADGTNADITGEATWSLDDATIGSFSGATLTATKTGTTKVHAHARSITFDANLTVSNPIVITTGGAGASAPSSFGGPSGTSNAPTLVYPPDGTMVPPNMQTLEFHFLPGTGNTLFELSFEAPTMDLKVYTGCTAVGAGCVYSPDAATWALMANSLRGGDPLKWAVRGVDGTAGDPVGSTSSRALSFGQEDITGGIYYWNAGAGATIRYEFGVSGKSGELFMNAPMAGATMCVGCHVLSRDGTRIVEGLDIPSPSPYKVFDVATRSTVFAQGSTFGGGGANFFTFSPDTSKIITSNAISLTLRDATSGAVIKDPLVPNGAMADWSPDGKTIVYALPTKPAPCIPPFCGATGVDAASIQTITTDGTTFAPGPTIVPYAGQNNYYPSFSPDGQWVVFNRSPSNANSYDAKDAQVWIVPFAGGAAIHLSNASTGGDSWAKWTPVVQKYRDRTLLWLTFSSRRAYGLRTADGMTAQLWMTAIDPTAAMAGKDPSYPAFWLPFQDVTSGNHIAQWVTRVVRKMCTGKGDCASGEDCVAGTCKPIIH
jgi:hypothetical protein